MNFFSFVSLAGGLALFLYGMNVMGTGLEKIAGGRTESVLQKLTSSTGRGVLFGAVATALLQSSSGTTVIIIGLVNSGIMQLQQAVGVVMGANIGTTVTAQLLRLTSITSDNFFLLLLKPSTLAPSIAFIGMILYIFNKNAKRRNVGQIMLGFGVLFSGMFAMEAAVHPLRESPLFAEVFASLQNPVLGILAGLLITVAVQSSSASVGILQALTITGVVTWSSAIPIILGQNIGTCATGLIACIGTSKAAKRVAFCHLYFNVIGTTLFIVIIYLIEGLIGFSNWDASITTGDVANFHLLFNVLATLIFLPFSKWLVRLAEFTVRDKPGEEHPELEESVHLDERLYHSPSLALAQAHRAVLQMAKMGQAMQVDSVENLVHYARERADITQRREGIMDQLEVKVTNYLINMNGMDMSEYESREVTKLFGFVTDYERIGDHFVNILERGGEVYDKGIVFSSDAQNELSVLSEAVGEILRLSTEAFENESDEIAKRVEPLEETIDAICETLRDRHIERLKKGVCNMEAGIVFLTVLADYERISDHCSGIATRLLSHESGAEDLHSLHKELQTLAQTEDNELRVQYNLQYFGRL